MPNFFTKTLQKISESFNGPRTNDLEYHIKKEKTAKVQKAMLKLRNIILNFNTYFEKLITYNKEINEVLFVIYEDDEENRSFAMNLETLHASNSMLFQKLILNLNELNTQTNSWTNYFSSVPVLIKNREESRKTNDHYEKKLESLYKDFESKMKKGNYDENSSFGRQLQRNEEKYVIAKEDYLKKATACYDTMDKLLRGRFELINPVIRKLIDIETTVYESLRNNYNKFHDDNNISSKKQLIIEEVKADNYNPEKFIRSPFYLKLQTPDAEEGQRKRHKSNTLKRSEKEENEEKNRYRKENYSNDNLKKTLTFDSKAVLSNFSETLNIRAVQYHNIDNVDPFSSIPNQFSNFESKFCDLENKFHDEEKGFK